MMNKQDLFTYFQSGFKSDSFIGLEVEHFILNQQGMSVPFKGPNGIESILKQLNQIYDGSVIYEKDSVIGFRCHQFIITIEPGGQLEISISPQVTIHNLKQIYDDFKHNLDSLLTSQQQYAISIGYHPIQTNQDIPWVPKQRYEIMAEYLRKKGALAHHMMKSTTSTQVTFDYKDEVDFSKKYSLSNRFSVLSSIIFECSPFYENQVNPSHLSRIQCWLHCDDERCGFMDKSFHNLYSFDDYINYILDIPMIVERTSTGLHPIGSTTYREYLASFPVEEAAFENQLTMVFPDIRLKNFIEVRTADGLPSDLVMSVPAFWTGLLYDDKNLNTWLSITKNWNYEDLINLRLQYIQEGNLDLKLYGKSIYEWVVLLLGSSQNGLERRSHDLSIKHSETQYLQPLIDIWSKKQSIKQSVQQHYSSSNLSITEYLQQYYKGGTTHEA